MNATAPSVDPDRAAHLRDRLDANNQTHLLVRAHLGIAPDPGAIRRIADFYHPPKWAVGCIGAVDALFLYDFVAGLRPDRVIEIGTAGGGSAAVLALAMHDADLGQPGQPLVQTFDRHTHCYFDRSRPVGSAVREMLPSLAPRVRIHTHATAIDAARLFAGRPVRLAFIDADHRHPHPTADLLALLPAIEPGGWVVLHDIDLPTADARYEAQSGQRVTWHEHGAQYLFNAWPHEKIAGVGQGANIGAIRIPDTGAVRAGDLADLIDRPWEAEPDPLVRAILERG